MGSCKFKVQLLLRPVSTFSYSDEADRIRRAELGGEKRSETRITSALGHSIIYATIFLTTCRWFVLLLTISREHPTLPQHKNVAIRCSIYTIYSCHLYKH
jgi:hypothetical protein